jgi:hypothetical protein
MKCAIWGTEAQLLESAGDFQVIDSPRAGGKYWISGTAIGQIIPFTDHAKRLLTTRLCEQRHTGVEIPRIRGDVLELIKSRQPLAVMTRFTVALLFLGRGINRLGDGLSLGEVTDADTLRCLAETESKDTDELLELLEMLHANGYVRGDFYVGGVANLRPTALGWQEIEKQNRPRPDSSQAFVAMWFNDFTDGAYIDGIVPALTALGYKPIRIDKKEHNNKIDDEILVT